MAARRRRRQNFVCGGAYPPFSSSSIKSWFGGACYIRNWWWSDPVFDFYQVQKIPISFQKSRETTARKKGGTRNSQKKSKKGLFTLNQKKKVGTKCLTSCKFKRYQEVFQKKSRETVVWYHMNFVIWREKLWEIRCRPRAPSWTASTTAPP